MKFNVLTQMQAKNLGAGKHSDGQGLWLIKREKGMGRWMLRIVVRRKRREMGLGSWPDVSIAEARERAATARRQLRDGLDPIEERAKLRHHVDKLTVEEAIAQCFEARKAQLKGDGDAGRWLSPLKVHVIPKIGSKPIEDVDQHLLKELLLPIWHEKPQAASKALNRINLTLKHAAALGVDVDLQACMKTRALLGKQRHEVEHIPAMAYSDVPAFYSFLEQERGVAALALRFLILTAARTSEVRLATMDEIDGDVWRLPAERTKNGREHSIPLSDAAIQIIEDVKAQGRNGHLFVSYRGKPLSDAAMSKFMRDRRQTARPHGFRASFRTWLEEKTDASFEVKETALGHHVDSGVVGAYQRSDRLEKRRALMRDWSSFLGQQRD
ncbi:MAG: integrase arm-type DNA-binding domain-containing protein [Erythrobacter sp.]